jgi:Carboxypeptidase regulatory-like domain/TonB-dependent Receptor Plug Domain
MKIGMMAIVGRLGALAVAWSAIAATGIAAVYAQAITTGTIEVHVTDETKAVLPGVTVTITNPDTGLMRSGVSDERGVFQFLNVPVGNTYDVKLDLSGFNTQTLTKVRVDPGTQVFNLSLKVGGLEETVQVAAAAPLIDTKSAATTQTMDNSLAEAVPLASRNYAEIASLFPAVVHTSADNSPTFVQFHVRGQPTTGHGYRIDGADTMTPFLGRTGSTLSPLAIDRLEFVSGGMPAEYGEQPGGIFNVITKSGTNRLAAAYALEYRPDDLNSTVVSGIPGQVEDSAKGNTHLEEFAVGGPIERDKVFYFGAYQFRQQDVGNILSHNLLTGRYHNAHAKVTYIQNATNTLNITGDVNTVNQHNTNLSSTVTAEAQGGQQVTIGIFNINQTHQFTPTLVVESQALFYHLGQTSPIEHETGHPNVTTVNAAGTLVTGQASTFSGWNENRLKGTGKLTSLAGSHTIKAGLDYSYSSGDRFQEQRVPILNDRRPIGGVLTRTQNFYNSPVRLDDRWFDVYAQDTWAVASRLAVQYGLRLDYQRAVGDLIPQPRVGFAWDLTGDGRNKLSASWGRMHQVIPGTQYTVDANYLQEQYRVTAPLGAFTGPEVVTNRFRTVRVGTQKNPTTKAGTVSFERLLPFNTRMTSTFAWSDIRDRQIGTRYSDRVEYVIAGRDKYRGLELSLQKYITHHFQLLGSYTFSRTEGDTESVLTELQAPYRYALVDYDSPHVATVSGTVELPYHVSLAPVFKFVTGRPYSVDNAQVGTLVTYIDKEGHPAGRNIYRMPNITSLDVSIGRLFKAGRTTFRPQLQLLNLTNRVNVLGVQTAFVSAGRPTTVDTGRQIQFGFDMKF